MTRDIKRALLRASIAILIILCVGSAGYLIIEDGWTILEAFYMTLITITTIGYGEIRPLSELGRIFTSLLIIGGIGTAATALTQIGSLVVESRISTLFGRKKMDERIKRISEHYIVCGFGNIGTAIATELDRAKISFVVIDSNESAVTRAESLGFPAVNGDASSDSTLVSAGIRRASGLVICIGDMTANLVISMAGRELNPALHIVARGSDPGLEERLLRAGADSVAYPLKLGGQSIARLIIEQSGQAVDQAMESEEPSILGYRVKLYRSYSTESGSTGATVADVLTRTGAVEAISLKRADATEIEYPGMDLVLEKGDALALLIRDRKKVVTEGANSLSWSEEMSVGISRIDEEHRLLLTLIDRIGEAAKKKSPRSEIAAIFDRLIDYTERHFAYEEQLFKQFAYPKAQEHALEHKRLTTQVMDFNRDRNSLLPENLSDFLLDWLKVHIMGTDKQYVDFFREKGLK